MTNFLSHNSLPRFITRSKLWIPQPVLKVDRKAVELVINSFKYQNIYYVFWHLLVEFPTEIPTASHQVRFVCHCRFVSQRHNLRLGRGGLKLNFDKGFINWPILHFWVLWSTSRYGADGGPCRLWCQNGVFAKGISTRQKRKFKFFSKRASAGPLSTSFRWMIYDVIGKCLFILPEKLE